MKYIKSTLAVAVTVAFLSVNLQATTPTDWAKLSIWNNTGFDIKVGVVQKAQSEANGPGAYVCDNWPAPSTFETLKKQMHNLEITYSPYYPNSSIVPGLHVKDYVICDVNSTSSHNPLSTYEIHGNKIMNTYYIPLALQKNIGSSPVQFQVGQNLQGFPIDQYVAGGEYIGIINYDYRKKTPMLEIQPCENCNVQQVSLPAGYAPPENTVKNNTGMDIDIYGIQAEDLINNPNRICTPNKNSDIDKTEFTINTDKFPFIHQLKPSYINNVVVTNLKNKSSHSVIPQHAFWVVTVANDPDTVIALIGTTYSGWWEEPTNSNSPEITLNGDNQQCKVSNLPSKYLGTFQCYEPKKLPVPKTLSCDQLMQILPYGNDQYSLTYFDTSGNPAGAPTSQQTVNSCKSYTPSEELKKKMNASGSEQFFTATLLNCEKQGVFDMHPGCTSKTVIIEVKHK